MPVIPALGKVSLEDCKLVVGICCIATLSHGGGEREKWKRKIGMVVDTRSHKTCGLETERLGVQSQPWLGIKFKTSLGYVRL